MGLHFGWKHGSRFTLDPQVVGEELESFQAKGHALTPEYVVKRARTMRSPLHPAFEWDDQVAAHEHRLTTARSLIRSIVVVSDVEGQAPIQRYVHVRPQDPVTNKPAPVYTTLDEVMEDPEMRAQVLARALRDFRALRKKYESLVELAAVFEALEKVAA